MTNEEAKEELKKFVKTKTSMQPVFFDVCLEALERQIPMKSISDNHEGHRGMKCVNCGKQVWINQRYCERCGQAISWEVEDDK